MRHIDYSSGTYDIAILIKDAGLRQGDIQKEYLDRLEEKGISTDGTCAFSLDYAGKKKPTAAVKKAYLAQLLPALENLAIKTILVCDGEYFKTLTKNQKIEPHYGYVHPCAIEGYEHMSVVLGVNYQMFFYKPDMRERLNLSIQKMADHLNGSYMALGSSVIEHISYPKTVSEVRDALANLHQYAALTSDIEAHSLKHYDAGIGTISFAWDKHNAVAFPVDYVATEPHEIDWWCTKDKKFKKRIAYGKQVLNPEIRALLKEFFETYQGKLIWHNICYDAYILVYQLWMDDLLDQKGLLEGLEIMVKNFDDTKLIAYLATNSCAGNKLSLKDQAHEFLGNYAQEDIKDIRLIPEPELLQYNALDCMGTWFVYEKRHPQMVADEQEDIYKEIFKPAVKDIIQMQLTGMCLDMDQVLVAEKELIIIEKDYMNIVHNTDIVKQYVLAKRIETVAKKNAEYKKKVITLDDFKMEFNPNSNPQMQDLLYKFMDLPVIDYTKNKAPATGADTIEKLINHTTDKAFVAALKALHGYSKVSKILSSFIPAFKNAPLAPDGYHYLFGSFNLGGTKSGRLSSSNVNLQQLPSTGSPYAKLIKKCFIAMKGWLFVGADSASLEDRISALTTKDSNKLKVYTDGFDGHSLRAWNYFPEAYAGIPETPEAINGTKHTHGEWRQESKAPTFALTYDGTWVTLVNNCGFSEELAKSIEANYHEMYAESDLWKQGQINQASIDGYVTGAFGLKLRTPMLKQVILNNSKTPYEAQAESRTAGNMLGQSWGLLNSRASIEVLNQVRNSKHALNIRPCAQIHDAVYYYIRDDIETLTYLNDIVGTAMAWQDHPDIWHEEVKLSGELDIFYPNWSEATTLPNGATQEQIIDICKAEVLKRKENK